MTPTTVSACYGFHKAPANPFRARFGATIGASPGDLRLDSSRRMGYTLKAMQAGLWASSKPAASRRHFCRP
jgi:hypothetical protein